MCKVSVIVPVYNVENYIYDMLTSCLLYTSFPDGLVGGPLGVMVEGPLLLINDRNTGNAADYVEDSDAYRCLALGGTSLISETAVRNIMNR